jgi:dipeptidyl aminopeptidase/acylaminoacyl peptidase
MMHEGERVMGYRKSAVTIALFIAALGGTAQSQGGSEKRLPTVDDLFGLRDVRDPQVSPDGRWVAYTVTVTDLKGDRRETRVWIAPLDGGPALPMTAVGASTSSPRWSPDGRFLSFLAARKVGEAAGDSEPKTQVWVLDRRGGEARELTHVRQGVEGYDWSPDGAKLVLVIKDTIAGKWEAKSPRPWVIDRLQFKRDEEGYLDARRTHLYVFALSGGSLTQVTSGDYDDADPAWSPDSRAIAFVSNRTASADANRNTDIWIVAADDTTRGKNLRQVTTNPGSDEQPGWSPDGKWLAYVTVTEPDIIYYAAEQLAVISSQGGAPRILSKAVDRNVARPHYAPDGGAIYFLLEDRGERHVARIAPGGGDLARPIAGALDASAFDVGPEGTLAALVSRPDLPNEIFRLDGAQLRQVTFTNDSLIATLRLADVQKVRFPSRDGTQIDAFIYTPSGFDRSSRYPTLLRIHGGPVSQYSFEFSFQAQLFAAHGYVVVLPNPRGSSGYGQAFAKAIWADWGNKDYEDVMAGVDYAIRQGYADPKRLGVGGWSYGGILTNYVITKSDRFAAAITGASEVLYAANYGHDHYQYEWEKELGLPWKSRQLWERLSPFNYVERIVTPTLVMGGEKDWNVPVQNSEQLYQALRRLGRTTELVVYPGESHGIRKPSYLKDRLERYLAWYDRYVKGAPITGAAVRP